MEQKKPQKISIITKEGQPFQVPVEGSLGLLALGYKGLVAWRQVKRQYQKARKEKQHANKQQAENINPDTILDPPNN
jgi:hypothetical protein